MDSTVDTTCIDTLVRNRPCTNLTAATFLAQLVPDGCDATNVIPLLVGMLGDETYLRQQRTTISARATRALELAVRYEATRDAVRIALEPVLQSRQAGAARQASRVLAGLAVHTGDKTTVRALCKHKRAALRAGACDGMRWAATDGGVVAPLLLNVERLTNDRMRVVREAAQRALMEIRRLQAEKL